MDNRGRINLRWVKRGDKAQSPPNPAYPMGLDVDLTGGQSLQCRTPLPYPAKEVGSWVIECHTCGLRAVVTAAGRVDDPRSVKLACKANA